ncbi:MAG TPA: ABC transporter substrate-binding protein [Burkholderiaceae bacterium]|nr:ABC transporter substrate-binding protein [Burkholderiaceae bacterium]
MNHFDPTRRALLGGTATALLASSWLLEAAAAEGGILTVALPSNPQTFDPANQSNHDAMLVNQLIFENLVEIDGDGKRVPLLAKSWTVSKDGLVYTFELRDDVNFHNGQRFTAEDVKYSYEWVLNPANKALRRPMWAPIESVTVASTTRVVFKLQYPYRPFLDYMTKYMAIFPAGSREKMPPDHFKSNPTGVGTGPAIFVASQANDHVELRRNPNYWRKGQPKWEKVIVRVIPEEAARVASLLSGQCQVIAAPPAKDFARLKASLNVSGAAKPATGCTLMITGNTKQAPFDDPHFRRAVALATDREQICASLCHGLVEPTAVPAAASSWWFNPQASKSLAYNLHEARAALRKSKYAGGTEFDLLYASTPYLIDTAPIAVFLQAQLAPLGIRVNLRPMDFGRLISQVLVGNHKAALMALVGPPEPTFLVQSFFRPTEAFFKATGYENPALTKLLEDSYKVDDAAQLKPILQQMQTVLANDAAAIWIGTPNVFNLWRANVRGFAPNSGLTLRVRDAELA